MPRITTKSDVLQQTAHARQLAETAAERYFGALAARIPFDTAPGDVDLIRAVCEIQEALTQRNPNADPVQELAANEDTELQAGYLLGVAIGRRMAGGGR